MGFEFQQLGDLDEKSMTFAFAGWLHSEWIDPRLTFEKDDLLWLDSVSVNPGTLWDPRVSLIALPSTLKVVSPTGGGYQMEVIIIDELLSHTYLTPI